MSEPYLPVPPPEEDGYHDPMPPLCSECGAILRDTRYSGPSLVGICERHGLMRAKYRDDSGDDK